MWYTELSRQAMVYNLLVIPGHHTPSPFEIMKGKKVRINELEQPSFQRFPYYIYCHFFFFKKKPNKPNLEKLTNSGRQFPSPTGT